MEKIEHMGEKIKENLKGSQMKNNHLNLNYKPVYSQSPRKNRKTIDLSRTVPGKKVNTETFK